MSFNQALCKDRTPIIPQPTIFSCREILRPAPETPFRSTFCYIPPSSFIYKSRQDITDLKRQWETFERIENYNSIVANKLANTIPDDKQVYYIYVDNQEQIDYTQGQLAHIQRYPDISDFLVPYAKKPILYTSTISTIISNLGLNDRIGPCPNEPTSVIISNEQRIQNRKSNDIYIRVSTQNAIYPKSPYKFGSNEEYLLYKKYKAIQSCK